LEIAEQKRSLNHIISPSQMFEDRDLRKNSSLSLEELRKILCLNPQEEEKYDHAYSQETSQSLLPGRKGSARPCNLPASNCGNGTLFELTVQELRLLFQGFLKFGTCKEVSHKVLQYSSLSIGLDFHILLA